MIQLVFILALFFLLPSFVLAQDITSGLVGHWKFDETLGTTAADSSGNNNTGILTNGPTWTAGKIGGAVSFDGVDDYVDAGAWSSLANLSAVTVSAWINAKYSDGADPGDDIVAKNYGGIDGWTLRTENESGTLNSLFFRAVFSGTDLEAYATDNSVQPNQWQHVAVIWDGSATVANVRFFVNGAEVAHDTPDTNGTGSRVDDSTRNLLIGINSTGDGKFDGLIDEVRVYNRVLTSPDIQALYTLGSGVLPPPPPSGDTQPPTTPTNLSAIVVSSSQVNLLWTASTDNVGVTGYRVERCQGSSCTNFAQIATPTGTTFNDTGLSANTTYRYQVRTMDAANNLSNYSSISSATTQQAGIGIPSALGWYQIPNTNLRSVCPPNGFGGSGYNFTDYCGDVTVAWNSAVFDTTRNRLIIWGGGHNNYYGNEIYAVNLNSLSIQRLNDPGLPLGNCGTSQGPGGSQANSRHTYDGIEYLANVDRMFVFGGAIACINGGLSRDTWTFNFTTNSWESKNPSGAIPRGDAGVVTAYDPNTGKVFLHDSLNLYAYTFSSDSYQQLTNNGNSIDYHMTAAIDPVRKKFVIFGGGQSWIYDISGGAYIKQILSTSGCSALVSAASPGLAYDPVSDRIVGWSGGNTVYNLNLDNNTCTTTTYSGDPGAAIQWGTFNRWQYSPISGVFIVVNSMDANAYTFRLTSGGGVDTTPPTVSITTPTSGSTVSGFSVTVSANASDNIGIAGVQFLLDGANLGTEDTTAPYSATWNTTTATNGSHTLTARARDVAGNTTTSSGVTVTVNNPTGDTQAPTAPTNLQASAQSSSQINLSWTASTDPAIAGQVTSGVTGYRVERCLGSTCTNFAQIATPTGTSYNDTGLTANTTYRYQVRAGDAAGNVSPQSAVATATTLTVGALPAFPGAEGFGTNTPGGRGGSILVVTNLNSSGPGSFREAILTTGPRIIVFRVSGVIDLGGDITLTEAHSNVTVLGQSSPGGITFINGSIGNYQTNFHDAIFRFIRIRSQAGDTIAFNPVYNLVIDHSDFSGGSDETFDIDASHDFTVQWSTILNSMSGTGSQNYGTLIAYRPTNNITLHHNFSAHHFGRCGANFHWIGSELVPVDGAKLDLRNNVFYNCGTQQIYRSDFPPAEGINFNLISNYAKSGPNTPVNSMLFGLGGTIYMNDNLYPGQSIMSIYSNPTYLSQPHLFPAITTSSAVQAYDDVLNLAGSWPRDAMTTRTVNEAKAGTGTLGKLDDPLNTSTGPTPPQDTDLDGIPDSWESSHGLNLNNPLDSRQIHVSGYANIEVYLNEIAQQFIGSPGTPPTPLLGDLNNDRTVNNFDWNIVAGVWFTNDPTADINKDGIVNTADFYFIYTNWNVTG